MAIKTVSQGQIPAVTLEYNHTDQFVMAVDRVKPHRVRVSAQVCAYGKDTNGDRVFSPKNKPALAMPDLDAYVTSKIPAERQAEAVAAMIKLQEAIGTLYDIYYGDTFVGVE